MGDVLDHFHVRGFNLLDLLAFAAGLDIRAVQVNEHLAEDMVDFVLIAGQLLIALIQQAFYIIAQNVGLFDSEGMVEGQRPPFQNAADILAAHIDVGIGKGEVIGKSAMVDDISRRNDPQLLGLSHPHNAVFVLVKEGY